MHKNRLSILVKSTYTRKKDLQNNEKPIYKKRKLGYTEAIMTKQRRRI
jgi:hypothetical protein